MNATESGIFARMKAVREDWALSEEQKNAAVEKLRLELRISKAIREK
jgi:hypothetical protein